MNKGLELLYVYVHDIKRCYTKTHFTFTNDYDISYDFESKKLNIQRKENPYKSFYGENISSINLIVGKNGSGKSTLIDLITSNTKDECGGWFALYGNKDSNLFYLEGNNTSLLPKETNNIRVTNLMYDVIFRYDFTSKSIINYEHDGNYNFPTKMICTRIPRKSDIFIVSDKSHDFFSISRIKKEFITNCKLTSIYSLFVDNIKITNNLMANNLEVNTSYDIGFGPTDIFDIHLPTSDNLNHKLKTIHTILEFSINTLLYKLSEHVSRVMQIPYHLRNINNDEGFLYRMNELLIELIKVKEEIYNHSNYDDISSIKFKNTIDELIKLLSSTTNPNILDTEPMSFKLQKYDKEIYSILSLLDEVIILGVNNNIFSKDNFESKITKISEGESLFLELFGNIYQALINDDKENYKTIILLLDEPDKSFHPEWSAKFIYMLKSFIENTVISNKLKFQIIITTHSPFMISDVPREYITCIDIDDDGNRIVKNSNYGFASNFYNIIQDSFFLSSSIGFFAENKINKWIKEINTQEIDLRRILEIKEEIEVIDDQVIKNALQNMISQKIGKKDLLIRLEILENEIAEIKQKLGDSND